MPDDISCVAHPSSQLGGFSIYDISRRSVKADDLRAKCGRCNGMAAGSGNDQVGLSNRRDAVNVQRFVGVGLAGAKV